MTDDGRRNIPIRFSGDLYARAQERAEAAKMNTSGWIRSLVEAELRRPVAGPLAAEMRRHEAAVMAALDGVAEAQREDEP